MTLYDKQVEVINSVWDNDETLVPAANMMGKDFVAALIAITFFLTRHPCRIVTTSVDGDQLEKVLWGEIGNFLQTSAIPLDAKQGGPLLVDHLRLRKVVNGKLCKLSYCIGRVAAKGEGMLGHHIANRGDGIPRTLFIPDEASGVDDESREKARKWQNRMLAIGNCYSTGNFFERDTEAGDLPYKDNPNKFRRKVIRITALDSPNVQAGLKCKKLGIPPIQLMDGVLPYEEYVKREEMWDEFEKTVGLRAKFYRGPELMLYPPHSLEYAIELAMGLKNRKNRRGRALACDPAEGGDDTVWTVVDEFGIIKQVWAKTPDTSVIPGRTAALGKFYDVPPERWVFDRGGGGHEHACVLRREGFDVMTVPFGGTVTPEPGKAAVAIQDRIHQKEEGYEYFDKRAQLYGELALAIKNGFAIPAELTELHRQLSKIPKTRDDAGRLKILPKNAPKNKPSLKRIVGRSPDHLESAAMAVYGMKYGPPEPEIEVLAL